MSELSKLQDDKQEAEIMELNHGGLGDRKFPGPIRPKRKLSIPVALSVPPNISEHAAFRRRFSNVGDAVSRKLSTTIGWRSAAGANPPEEVVAVGRALCSLYIRTRLKRAGVFNRKLGLTRVRSAVGTMPGCGTVVRDVFPGLQCACLELERMYPKLYTNVTRQTGFLHGNGVSGILLAVGHYLLREPTWGKVVAVFTVAGALAVDCVRYSHHEQLPSILDDMTELLEDKMAEWVNFNGGWTGLMAHCKAKDQEISYVQYLTIFGLVAIVLLVAYFVVRFCVKIGV
ncbi:bcl-2-related ovarian killer protein homolog A isoform X2 [Anoplophora glabripennis]|uniref:bcl-2-related ovarian killer protein homolog A isoform X2 n=1 Tax=Anoplophora glabripennis TaxID=217634 RepID=UPI0008757F22|nr:bcl-2-related ovarian killer protein homolog A isoform X2 [Anoplophora glabripennis]